MGQARDEAGNIWETDAQGNAMRLISHAQADQPQPPADPTFPYKGQQAQAGLDSTQVGTQKTQQDMQHSSALFDAQKREQEARAALAQYQAQQAQAGANEKNPLNLQALQGVGADAMAKLKTIDRIRRNVNSAWLPAVGLGAQTTASIGGTNARNVSADLGSLKAGGALSEVLKMSQATGRNPLSPMSNSDVDLISNNTGNLDQGQSRGNFNANLQNYQDAYTHAYAGSVGLKTLNSEIERLMPSIPPERREAFKADALRRYTEHMSNGSKSATANAPRRKSSSVIDFNDWGN